ncbi:type I secretion C-terminal target domain-containing protein [Pseudoroseomonas wenyumeiae]
MLKSYGLDILDGGEGRDALESSAYGNVLTGGTGADLFVYGNLVMLSSFGIRTDTITDFNAQEGDRLDLSVLLDQASGDPVAGGWLGVESVSDGTALLFDADGGGDGFVQLAILQGVSSARRIWTRSSSARARRPWPGPFPVASRPSRPLATRPVSGLAFPGNRENVHA